MKIGTVVSLDETEQEVVRSIAQKRYDSSIKNNLQDTRPGICDPFIADLEGFAAEFAFCKMANCFPDFIIGVHAAKNDKGDCIYNGYSIDVKTTKNPYNGLIVKPWKKGKVDAFASFTGVFPNYIFRGFCPAFSVFVAANLKEIFGKKNYIIHHSRLMDEHTFLETMKFDAELNWYFSHKEQAI